VGRGMEDAYAAAAIPRRPSGVEPEGRLQGSGFAERQWLPPGWLLAARRPHGHPGSLRTRWPRLKRRFRKGWRGACSRVAASGSQAAFVAYTLLALPAIVGLMGYVVWNAPSIFQQDGGGRVSAHRSRERHGRARKLDQRTLAVLEIVILALPAIGLAFFFLVIALAVTRFAWRRRAAPSAPGAHPVEPGAGLEGYFASSPSSHACLRRSRSRCRQQLRITSRSNARLDERSTWPHHRPSRRVHRA
jgi:hypothetical protein